MGRHLSRVRIAASAVCVCVCVRAATDVGRHARAGSGRIRVIKGARDVWFGIWRFITGVVLWTDDLLRGDAAMQSRNCTGLVLNNQHTPYYELYILLNNLGVGSEDT